MRRVFVALLALLLVFGSAVATPVVPQDAYKYRSILIRSARAVWGLADKRILLSDVIAYLEAQRAAYINGAPKRRGPKIGSRRKMAPHSEAILTEVSDVQPTV